MKIIPRSYQAECVQTIWEYFRTEDGNPVCALPTGTGKSVVIAAFLESVYQQFPTQKILVATHVKELIAQNYEKLINMWPGAPAGIYSAGLGKRDLLQKIIFCGIGSVAKRAHEFGHVDLIIVDECHLVSPSESTMYRKFFEALKNINPYLKIIGFTATPWRLGHGKITDEGGIFTDTCFDITGLTAFNRLIAEGFLAPLIPKPTRAMLDVDGVHMRGGEFIPAELQRAVDRDEITHAALKEAMEYIGQRHHWLIFAAGVEHAINVSNMLSSMGVSCKAVHSKMSSHDRDQALLDFKAGRITAVVNNNVLTTGFDFPGIDLIVCLRPTASSVLWVQMIGRGTRPSPGKDNCLVLDFAGNTRRLGPINDPLVPRKKGQKGGDAPVKICPECDCYVHASVKFCTGVHKDGTACHHEFVFETKLLQGASTTELIKGDLPVVETFKIEHINFTQHQKMDRPPMIKVSYYCGYRMFEEYVCVEHEGFAGRKARQWLRERTNGAELPVTTMEALARAEDFKVPTHMKVWTNKKYPEIMSFCWDGSAFGQQEIIEDDVPTVQSYKPKEEVEESPSLDDAKSVSFDDDDIPF